MSAHLRGGRRRVSTGAGASFSLTLRLRRELRRIGAPVGILHGHGDGPGEPRIVAHVTDASSAGPVRILRLVPVPGWSPDYPRLEALIDGENIFEQGLTGCQPQLAGALLNPPSLGDVCPLEPVPLGRHVALAVCSCGDEGCGVVAPLIVSDGAHVVWRQFVDATGWFIDALGLKESPRVPTTARRLPIRPVRFAAEQYLAEVRHLQEDRSWESPNARAARMVQEVLWRAQSRDGAEDVRVVVRPSAHGGLAVRWSGRDTVGFWYRDASLPMGRDESAGSVSAVDRELEQADFWGWMHARAGEPKRTGVTSRS